MTEVTVFAESADCTYLTTCDYISTLCSIRRDCSSLVVPEVCY